jgi:hypothetical protein
MTGRVILCLIQELAISVSIIGGKTMPKYFVFANSFAAPLVSDRSMGYISSENAESVMLDFVETYNHPCGLYSANLYKSADDYYQNLPPLVEWRSNYAIMTDGVVGFIRIIGPNSIAVNGIIRTCENPKDGKITKRPPRTER